jgi:hypothetical protein
MSDDRYKVFEEIAFDHLLKRYGWKVCTTPQYSLVDGIAVKDNEITHVVEFKSRNESMESIERFGSYLISYDKIENGLQICRMMRVPFILIVYLIKDGVVMGIEIGDEFGVSVEMEIKETRTQKSIEGGTVIRRNAFIDLENFYIL